MKIGIIGAGPAGLSAGRHCLEQGHQIDIFEQTGRIGGTWVYTDDIGLDQHGLAIHSSMYTGLRLLSSLFLFCLMYILNTHIHAQNQFAEGTNGIRTIQIHRSGYGETRIIILYWARRSA